MFGGMDVATCRSWSSDLNIRTIRGAVQLLDAETAAATLLSLRRPLGHGGRALCVVRSHPRALYVVRSHPRARLSIGRGHRAGRSVVRGRQLDWPSPRTSSRGRPTGDGQHDFGDGVRSVSYLRYTHHNIVQQSHVIGDCAPIVGGAMEVWRFGDGSSAELASQMQYNILFERGLNDYKVVVY